MTLGQQQMWPSRLGPKTTSRISNSKAACPEIRTLLCASYTQVRSHDSNSFFYVFRSCMLGCQCESHLIEKDEESAVVHDLVLVLQLLSWQS
jgi:hypothetical protein